SRSVERFEIEVGTIQHPSPARQFVRNTPPRLLWLKPQIRILHTMQAAGEKRQSGLAAAEPNQVPFTQVGRILRDTSENEKPLNLHSPILQPIDTASGSHPFRDGQAPLHVKGMANCFCFAPHELPQLL